MHQPTKFRDEKVESALTRLAAEFIRREASPQSLITVTSVHYEDRGNRATVTFSVLPESEEQKALAFLSRKASDLQDYIKEHIRMRAIPFITFAIDKGEKNRQRIDELSRE